MSRRALGALLAFIAVLGLLIAWVTSSRHATPGGAPSSVPRWARVPLARKTPMRIGIAFHDESAPLYRAYIAHRFPREKPGATLVMRGRQGALHDVPIQPTDYDPTRSNVDGRLLDQAMPGGLMSALHRHVDDDKIHHIDAICAPAYACMLGISNGVKYVFVATLGCETRERPGHAIFLRKGVHVTSPRDLRGRRLEVEPGVEELVLTEFLAQNGLVPGRDVQVVQSEPEQGPDPTSDGGFYPLYPWLRAGVISGEYVIYRRVDWVDPRIMGSMLAFRPMSLLAYKPVAAQVIEAYRQQLKAEASQPALAEWREFHGLYPPRPPDPPLVNPSVLADLQRLMLRHRVKKLRGAFDLAPWIVNDVSTFTAVPARPAPDSSPAP